MNAFLFPRTGPISRSATARHPFFWYTLSGARNQSMFSLLMATVLMLSRCLTPTFSLTELPPQLPHPRVSEGAREKL